MNRSISILIPTHNRAAILSRTLRSLFAVTVPARANPELIVVANACTDETRRVCDELLPAAPFPARCVAEPQLGASCARNRAVQESRGEVCAFFDDDVVIARDWLQQLLRCYEELPADLVAGKVDLEWEQAPPAWLTHRFESFLSANALGDEPRELHDFSGVVGANFSFRREVFERCGAFQAEIGRIGGGMMAFDESEFVLRALSAGFRLFSAPDAKVRHWTPIERANPQYICRAAAGFAEGRVMAKADFGPRAALRCFAGHAYLFVKSGVRELLALSSCDRERILKHRVWRITGQSGFLTALRRCLGRRPQFAPRLPAVRVTPMSD